jgi:restriction system protein
MHRTLAMIDNGIPPTWQDLQAQVAVILKECGMRAEVERNVPTARGLVNLDVWAADPETTPPITVACECKHWRSSVPKAVVHSFRTVMADAGASVGLIVSAAGFQKGAYEAVAYSNIRLVTWLEFQQLFEERWYQRYFVRIARQELARLMEFCDPKNWHVRKLAKALGIECERRTLLYKHHPLAYLILPYVFYGFPMRPTLPLRATLETGVDDPVRLPDDMLDADTYRTLLGALCKHAQQAIAEIDAAFGGPWWSAGPK